MGKIISIHSFRGGTGKSNVTANLAALVATTGKRVGLIDTDIQSPGVHAIFGLPENRDTKSLNDFLWGRCPISDAAHDVTAAAHNGSAPPPATRLFLVPSSLNTAEIAKVLRDGYDVALLNEGFQELIRTLELDYLFIDTHPGVNEETLLSIAVSHTLVLLMRPDQQDFQGTAVTVELARRLQVNEMLLVLNKVPPLLDRQQLRERVEASYGVPVAAMLPLNFEIAQMGSSGLFTKQYPEHPFSRELQFVSRRLLA